MYPSLGTPVLNFQRLMCSSMGRYFHDYNLKNEFLLISLEVRVAESVDLKSDSDF